MDTTSAQPRVSRRGYRMILMAIILFGALLRLYGLWVPSLWYDEGCTFAQSQSLTLSLDFINTETISDPPLPIAMTGLWKWILSHCSSLPPYSPTSDFLLHLLPCVLSILSLPLTYCAGKALLKNDAAAIIATFLCAISPFQIYYAQELKAYAHFLVVWLGAFYCFIKVLENDRPRHWIGMVLLQILSMYTHFFSVWNIFLFNLYFALMLFQHREKLVKWTLSQAVVLLFTLPMILLVYEWSFIFNSITLNSWSVRPDAKTAFITFKTFFAGYSASSLVYWPLFAMTAVLFLSGLFALRRKKSVVLMILLQTVFLILLNVLVWRMRNFPFYEHRVFIFAAAIVYMTVAYGIVALPHKVLRTGIVILICLFTFPALRDYYVQNLHPMQTHRMGVRYKVDNRDAAAYIASQWKPGDKVGHTSSFTLMPFRVYLPGAPQAFLRLSEEELFGFLASLPADKLWSRYGIAPVRAESFTQDAPRVWLVESWWEPRELAPSVLNLRGWFDTHFTRVSSQAFDGVTTYLYVRKPQSGAQPGPEH
ncbi:MAG TPA: glycosyltransferase family 39 protein [Candidatus Hydrogenedentes bacterium]|nr:glycosyltransferase family 39 protein [Candidatus Hydrogenedentota bacterium]